MQANSSLVEFLRVISKFRKRKEISPSLVYSIKRGVRCFDVVVVQ